MSSLWSNAELLYSMPAVGATVASTTQSVITGKSAACPPCQLPLLGSIWPVSQLPGKALKFTARGAYDATNVGCTFELAFDTVPATLANPVATSGAGLVPSATTGVWEAELDLTCISVGSNTSGWIASGHTAAGIYQSATAGFWWPWGGLSVAGVPSVVSLVPTTQYYPELWVTQATAFTAQYCSQFMVYALN